MDLMSALMHVKQGESIHRASWENKAIQVAIHVGALCIKMEDGIFHPWTITEADMYSYDWEQCNGEPSRVLPGLQRMN